VIDQKKFVRNRDGPLATQLTLLLALLPGEFPSRKHRVCWMPPHPLSHHIVHVLSLTNRLPAWSLVKILRFKEPRLYLLSRALYQNNLTLDELRDKWNALIHTPDIRDGVRVLEGLGYLTSRSAERRPPSWVMLYLATYKVKSSANALEDWLPFAQDYVRTLGQSELDLAASLLVLSSLHYSRYNLIGPLQRAVDEFISLPLPSLGSSTCSYFSTLLISMSRVPLRDKPIDNGLMKVLQETEAREFRLPPIVYSLLLNSHPATLELTNYLEDRMNREGVAADLPHFEAFLRIFAKEGLIEDAATYYHKVQGTASSDSLSETEVSDAKVRADLSLMAAAPNHAAAFDFLKTTTRADYPYQRRKIPVHDFTAAFHRASKDPKVDSGTLIHIFNSSVTSKASDYRSSGGR
jgi:hypothetical protein